IVRLLHAPGRPGRDVSGGALRQLGGVAAEPGTAVAREHVEHFVVRFVDAVGGRTVEPQHPLLELRAAALRPEEGRLARIDAPPHAGPEYLREPAESG